jgi:hypothetical protein
MRNMEINGQRCKELEEEAKFDAFMEGCDYYHYRGTLCGCKNAPPAGGCSLCVDGSELLFPDRQVLSAEDNSGTCSHINELSQYVYRMGTLECAARQAVYGEYCGCEANVAQIAKECSLCGSGNLTVANDPAPTYSYLSSNGETNIHHSGKTCLEAEVEANELMVDPSFDGHQICSGIRQQLAEACCREPIATPLEDPIESSEIEGNSTAADTWNATASSENMEQNDTWNATASSENMEQNDTDTVVYTGVVEEEDSGAIREQTSVKVIIGLSTFICVVVFI